jgi:hypothetical protein
MGAEVGNVSSDDVCDYIEDARRSRRQRFTRGSLLFTGAAVACGALATRMSDIGHAVGFGALGAALLVAAGAMLWNGRRQ